MKKIILALVCLFLSLYTSEVSAQRASQPRWNQASWEPGLGMVFRHQEKFSAARVMLGTRNLFIKNRVGAYYILEYRGGIQFAEDNSGFYFRDLAGLNYSVNKSFSVRGGIGLFRKGILQSGAARGGDYFYNNIQFGRLRKEIGITYKIPQYPVSIDICYSTWVGPTATFGYVIPMKKKLGNAPLKSIPVYEKPVVVETKPEPEIPVKVIDTIAKVIDTLEKVVVVEPVKEIQVPVTPVPVPVPVPVPEPVKPVVVEPVKEKPVNLDSLAKQSTTYYPFNVATLNEANEQNLEALVAYMKANPTCKATLYGNADRLGSESYNLTLSASRANNVKTYLVAKGIAANRIKVIANGETKSTGDTEEERAKNRCVEFRLVKP